ncbi:GNAT family N-acetyltransferase [Heyndrickxia faecalis]|uniref:GNAT family N-acetyltransferase n=1 Tax=Heyndrickxia faecalis TaxID=2824910 RepID=UPI001B3A1C2D|nr:GNAT family N-acetyltransferase [Heyndrickxia faecalis]MBQ4912279.1 GNAT family N-acetyltransferase [Heyndrickxia faecalis]
MPLLANNKIILRSISEKDLDGLFSLYANEEVMRFFGRMAAKNKQEVLKIIEQNIQMKKEGTGIRYAAYLKATDDFVGIITLKRYNARNMRAEIDYIVAPEHQRKGLATEMLGLFLNEIFNKWNLERISTYVFLENTASCKLLEKFNFTREGILRHWTCVNGKFYDSYSYSLLSSDRTQK